MGAGAATRAGARHRGRLRVVFALTAAFVVVEAVTALATSSLALLADAGHLLSDVAGLAMALAAISAATRARAAAHRTFGLYRLEVLAALANALLLVGVAAYVVVEAVRRLDEPVTVQTTPVIVVATLGLAVNVAGLLLLRPGAGESLNVRGAYLEVAADALGSVGVLIAAVLVATLGWTWADGAVAAVLAVAILPRTARLAGAALRVLVQAAPPHLDVPTVQADLEALTSVESVHDLHVWTLSSSMDVVTAHLMVTPGTDTHAVLDQARQVLAGRHGVEHATLQIEPTDHTGCAEIDW